MNTRMQLIVPHPEMKNEKETHIITLWTSGDYDQYFDGNEYCVTEFWGKIISDLLRGVSRLHIDDGQFDENELAAYILLSATRILANPEQLEITSEPISEPDPLPILH